MISALSLTFCISRQDPQLTIVFQRQMAAACDWLIVHFGAKSNLASIDETPHVHIGARRGNHQVDISSNIHDGKPDGLRNLSHLKR